MATSQNGWTVFTSGTHRSLTTIPWVTGRVRGGSVAQVFDYLGRRFNAEVEPIRRDWSWGYAYRAIRGKASGYSNHASGTAVDFNAPKHVLGARGTFSSAQRAAIYRILRDLDHVVRWGGDYSGRADEMHFEINASASRVTAVTQRLTAKPVTNPLPAPKPPSIPTPIPTPREWFEDMTPDDEARLRQIIREEVHGLQVGRTGRTLGQILQAIPTDFTGTVQRAIHSTQIGNTGRTFAQALQAIPTNLAERLDALRR